MSKLPQKNKPWNERSNEELEERNRLADALVDFAEAASTQRALNFAAVELAEILIDLRRR